MLTSYHSSGSAILYHGDVISVLPQLPSSSVHCVVTSPPYFALRSYLPKDDPLKSLEIGSEPTPEQFVETMVAVFREVRRVLRDDGVCFVNLGDGYGNGNRNMPGTTRNGEYNSGRHRNKSRGTSTGNLLNMPHRVAEALRADGWIWRQTIVWSKRNPLPESVSGWRWVRCKKKLGRVAADWKARPKGWQAGSGSHDAVAVGNYRQQADDSVAEYGPCPGCPKCEPHGGYVLRRGSGRCTTAHEYVFIFAKTNRYFWDGEASKEGATSSSGGACVGANGNAAAGARKMSAEENAKIRSGSRNPRSVWTISSEPTKARHFACVDSETECLTVNGWKRYDELAVGEMAAQYDLDTRRLSWGAIEAVATYHVSEQEMVVGRGRDFDFWLTPNHRCVVVNRRGEARIVEASNLNRCHQFPIGGQWEDSGSGPGLEWAELIGWYIAEGHEKKNGLGVELYQSKSDNPEFCQRIENLLLAVEAEYESATYARVYRGRNTLQMAFHVHGFAAAKLRSLCPNKILPHGCLSWSNAECQALLSGLCMGDGSARDGGRITFVQKRKDVSDMVHAMAIRCGLSASMKTDETLNRLYFARRHTRSFRGTNGNGDGLRLERYTGVVWCPKLPLGTWVARRHGRVFITGNTFPSELVRRCLVAGVSAGGCCPHCGAPWAPVVEINEKPPREDYKGKNLENDPQNAHRRMHQATKAARMNGGSHDHPFPANRCLGYRPTCSCPPYESTGCVVLDPFAGIGTTGQTAIKLGHTFIGIDLNSAYLDIAKDRIYEPPRWWIRKQKQKSKARQKPSLEQGVLF